MKLPVIMLLFCVLVVTSCRRSDREHLPDDEMFMGVVPYDQFKPVPFRKRQMDYIPAGNESYAQGYKDGCRTFSSAVADGMYRLRGPKIDAEKMSDDPWYLRGFDDASTACTFNFDWEMH